MPSITLRSLRKRLGYRRGFLTPEGAARLGVKPGEVHYLPSKLDLREVTDKRGRVIREEPSHAVHVYRGAHIAGHVPLGPDGIIPIGRGTGTRGVWMKAALLLAASGRMG